MEQFKQGLATLIAIATIACCIAAVATLVYYWWKPIMIILGVCLAIGAVSETIKWAFNRVDFKIQEPDTKGEQE